MLEVIGLFQKGPGNGLRTWEFPEVLTKNHVEIPEVNC